MTRLLRRSVLALSLVSGGLLLAAVVALAAPVDPDAVDLSGGGVGGSLWDIDNDGGTDNGLPTGGSCEAAPGLNVDDAELDVADSSVIGNQSDAYDTAAMVWVNDTVFVAPNPSDLTGATLNAGPVAMSGLNVTVQYYAASASATLRTLATFTNPSGAGINATITWENNNGSDSGSGVRGSSSGDASFTTADRWVVTSDDPTDAGDPVNTYVLFGSGSPAETPTVASLIVCDDSSDDGVLSEFDISVPAGATRHLMFFNQLNQTNGEGITGGAGFDTNPPEGGDLLSGLTSGQLSDVLNWDFAAPPPADTPTQPAPTAVLTTEPPPVAPTATTAAIAAPNTGSGDSGSGAPFALWAALATLLTTTAGAGALSYVRRR